MHETVKKAETTISRKQPPRKAKHSSSVLITADTADAPKRMKQVANRKYSGTKNEKIHDPNAVKTNLKFMIIRILFLIQPFVTLKQSLISNDIDQKVERNEKKQQPLKRQRDIGKTAGFYKKSADIYDTSKVSREQDDEANANLSKVSAESNLLNTVEPFIYLSFYPFILMLLFV